MAERALSRAALDSIALPAGAGGGTNSPGGGSGGGWSGLMYGTNEFWLEPVSVGSNLFNVVLHGTTNGSTYLITSTEALNPATNSLWLVEGSLQDGTNDATPFALGIATRTNNLFIRAQACDECASTALPLWWQLAYFGVTGVSAEGDYDGDGVSNLTEYLQGTDPNKIRFTLSVTNEYVTTTVVPLQASILGGVPSYIAVLVNDTNAANASWQPYVGTDINVFLASTDGVYQVWVGMKGLPLDAQQTWEHLELTLDRAAPVLTITNPVLIGSAATVIKPYLQLAGCANEPLAAVSYDLANAAGSATNLDAFVTDRVFDTNCFDFTTTCFQCFDVPLTNGPNVIALHATDLSGNVTTTNLTVTLDYTNATTPPVLNVFWPTNGIPLSGQTFYVRGWLSDETATVAAQIVDAQGNTNVVEGLVERNGVFWVENLPLASGDSTVIVTATDAAGNVTTTNLIVSQSDVTLTIQSTPTGLYLYQATGSVSGTISDTNYSVIVNGFPATVYENGWWSADNVPIRGQGTATFDAIASSASSVAASRAVEMPAFIALVEYHDTKSVRYVYSGGLSDTFGRTKEYRATYQADPSGTWTSALHGTATDTSTSGDYWSRYVYDWTDTVSTTHFTDSTPQDTFTVGIYETYSQIAGVPDRDLRALGSPGSPPAFVDHYYASGVHHRWTYDDGGTAEAKVKARTRQKVFTGGKSLLKRKSLIHINAWASQYGKPPASPWMDTPVQDVAPTKIKVFGRWLVDRRGDDTGDLYLVLPDNTAQDLSLRIPGVKHYYASASVEKARLDANSVTFEGCSSILQDNGDGPYPPPHWQTNEVDHTVISWPVLYVSGSNVQTTTIFTNHARGPAAFGGAFPLVIKGEVSGGGTSFKLWGTNTAGFATFCSVPTFADHPLTPDTVDFYNPMTIHWYYGYTNKPDYLDAGTTTNQVYVILRAPTNDVPLYHTVVHLACVNAVGQTDPAGTADAVYSGFTGRSVRRVSDNVEMTYWYNDQLGARQTAELLQRSDANGNCESWSALLRDCFRAQGIEADRIMALPALPSDHSILVKNWQFNDPPSGSGTHPYIIGTNAFDLPGVPGQGNANPPGAFNGHWITLCSGAYYDPSYGTAKVTGANKDKNYEDGSLDGYGDGLGGARKNDTSSGSASELTYQIDN